MTADEIPETYPPSPRVADRCAACGAHIEVVVRAWEWLGSFWGKAIGANLCEKTRCKTKADATPEAIVREVDRRRKAAAR